MNRLHHLAFLVVLFGCWRPEDERSISEMDNFNPFDENFEFHDNIQFADYDTIIGECGYWHLAREDRGVYIFYQLFNKDPEIWAKGFTIDLDEVEIPEWINQEDFLAINDLFLRVPIDTSEIRTALTKFDIVDFKVSDPAFPYTIQMIDSKGNKFVGYIHAWRDDKTLRRYVEFNNSKNDW
jgi:hypothetical protein